MIDLLFWNTIQAAGMAVFTKAASRITWLRRRPAVLHVLWVCILLKLVTPPLIGVPLLPATVPVSGGKDYAVAVPASDDMPQTTGDRRIRATQQNAPSRSPGIDRRNAMSVNRVAKIPVNWSPRMLLLVAFGVTWGCGTIVLLGVFISRLFAGRSIARIADDGNFTRIAKRIALELGSRKSPPVRVIDAPTSPALLGCISPCVILPRRSIEALSEDELRNVLAHEVAHFVRRDHFVVALATLIRALVWWNPIAWWACREMRVAQELACDSLALSLANASAASYANALWKVVNLLDRNMNTRVAPAVGIGSAFSARTLRWRFEMISDQTLSPRLPRSARALFVAFAAFAACFPTVGNSQSAGDDKPAARSTRTRVRSSSDEQALVLPRIAESFLGGASVSGSLISGKGIVRRIDGNEIHFRSGDFIATSDKTIVVAPGKAGLQVLTPAAIRPGMAIGYSMNLQDGGPTPQRITLIGAIEASPLPDSAHKQIKEQRLVKLGSLSTSLDGRFPIKLRGKTGEVAIKIGETKLIELPAPTKSVKWQQGAYQPESIEDFEDFDHLLIEWLANGRMRATCYRTP